MSSYHAFYDVQFSERCLCIVQASRFFAIFCNDKLLSSYRRCWSALLIWACFAPRCTVPNSTSILWYSQTITSALFCSSRLIAFYGLILCLCFQLAGTVSRVRSNWCLIWAGKEKERTLKRSSKDCPYNDTTVQCTGVCLTTTFQVFIIFVAIETKANQPHF